MGGSRRVTEKTVPALTIGAVLGDSDSGSMAWSREIGKLSTEVIGLREGVESAVRISVVFHVEGRLAPNDFDGVRTGRFDKRTQRLVVQAAVGDPHEGSRRKTLVNRLREAIDVAEAYLKRKKLAEALPEIRALVESLDVE